MFRTHEELSEDDSTIDRPDSTFQGRKYAELDKLCHAEYLSNYYLIVKPKETTNDNQPEILTDDLILINHELIDVRESCFQK